MLTRLLTFSSLTERTHFNRTKDVLKTITNLLFLHPELVLKQLEESPGLLIIGEVVNCPHHRASVWWSVLASWFSSEFKIGKDSMLLQGN